MNQKKIEELEVMQAGGNTTCQDCGIAKAEYIIKPYPNAMRPRYVCRQCLDEYQGVNGLLLLMKKVVMLSVLPIGTAWLPFDGGSGFMKKADKKGTLVRLVVELVVDDKEWSSSCDESIFFLRVGKQLNKLGEVADAEVTAMRTIGKSGL